MKVMILAAGRGERLKPLTNTTPKPLIKAGKYRLIEYLIIQLVAAGFSDIIINYAHLGEQFPNVLGTGEKYNAKLSYSPEQEGGLETAGGIIKALPLIGNEPFLVVNGDIWTDFPFSTLKSRHFDPETLCHLILVNNPEHNPSGDFALHDNHIMETGVEKFTFSGIGVYNPTLFEGFNQQRLALKPVLLEAIKKQAAFGERYEGSWSDIGTIDRLEELRQQLSA
jgi:MurNAc alpha-1-phosphate uridylyltransferase